MKILCKQMRDDGATAYRASPFPELSPCQQPLITTFVAEKTKEKFTLFANAAATACGCLLRSIFRFSFSLFVERKIAEY